MSMTPREEMGDGHGGRRLVSGSSEGQPSPVPSQNEARRRDCASWHTMTAGARVLGTAGSVSGEVFDVEGGFAAHHLGAHPQ